MSWRLYQGDALTVLKSLSEKSVHCCVTSPPYFGLRDYGLPLIAWPEVEYSPMPGLPSIKVPAWKGQLGMESTPEMYVAHLVLIFREVRRVLRGDGTMWLNLGDSYNGSGGAGGDYNEGGMREGQPRYPGRKITSLKPKDLISVPWRVALALQADGWWLRSDIIWVKGNPMPESVKDRPTNAHEYVFLLSKSSRYYYDAETIKEPLAGGSDVAYRNRLRKGKQYDAKDPYWKNFPTSFDETGKNRRSVWFINTKPYKGAHFAVFPPELPELCTLAGTSPMACPTCGAPWERIIAKDVREIPQCRSKSQGRGDCQYGESPSTTLRAKVRKTETIGWRPTCSCPNSDGSGRCVVLDTFAGSGTTLLVAESLGRDSIGLELNPVYCSMIEERMKGVKIKGQNAEEEKEREIKTKKAVMKQLSLF